MSLLLLNYTGLCEIEKKKIGRKLLSFPPTRLFGHLFDFQQIEESFQADLLDTV